MYKSLVFFAMMVVVAKAAPAPGFLHGYPVAYPVATSHSSRIDIHSKPLIVAAAPAIVHAPIISAPIVKTIIPAAVSHSSRYDVHSAPIVTYGHGYYGGHGGYGLGLGHGVGLGHGYGLGYGHGYGHAGLWGHY